MELTFRTVNYKRIHVFTGHDEYEYLKKFNGRKFRPIDVLNGINDDETKPGEHKKYWVIGEKRDTMWYEIPENYHE